MIKTVKLQTKEDVERLNNIATKQDFDMSVSCGSTMIDAKSLLALFTLVGKSVHIVAPDGLNPKYFDKMVRSMNLAEA